MSAVSRRITDRVCSRGAFLGETSLTTRTHLILLFIQQLSIAALCVYVIKTPVDHELASREVRNRAY